MHLAYVALHEMTWCFGCMVYTERAEMAAVSCETSHASAASTPLGWISKTRYKKLLIHVESYIVQELCESRGGRPGLSVLTSLLVSVDVKIY